MEAPDSSPTIPADVTEPLKHRLREAALIGLLALTLNLAGNGRVSLWDRDEPRYAGCVREMQARGDWIFPTFNAEPRFHKPILIYWLMRAGVTLGGNNPFGARLVSSVAGAATCLLVWALGRRMFGRRAGRLAALCLAASPIMVVESKLATTDATLAFFFVGCQFCLWELARRPSRVLAALFWIGLALGTLTKGPVAPTLIVASGLVSWWWGGPTECWKRLGWRWGPALCVMLTAPWYIAIGLMSRGEFFDVAIGYHVIRRATTGIEQHGHFPGYYLVASLVAFYPWSALVPAAVLGAWTRRKGRPEFGFLLGWVIGPLVVFEIARTKLIHYYLPAYPACALLVAWLIEAVAADVVNLRRWPLGRLGLALLSGIGIGGVVGLVAGTILLPGPMRWPCLALAAMAGAGSLYAIERFYQADTRRAATALVATWAAVLLVSGAWLLPSAEPYRVSRIIGERLATYADQERATPVLCTFQQPGVIYSLGRPAVIFRGKDDLVGRLRHGPSVVSALLPGEVAAFRKDPRLHVEIRETVQGFNVDKMRTETLHMALIRLQDSALAGRGKQSDVK